MIAMGLIKRSVVVLGLILLVACGSGPGIDEPPDIRYGEDACERCAMSINEARYAAAYVRSDGGTRRFDDIGGMAAYNDESAEDVDVFWVHDYDTEEWIKADEAYFVKSKDLLTPMGFGIVAFASQERAVDWAGEQGALLQSYSELFG